ncbi:MAG: zinc ribbon domain-containing protein [Lachnospiraceae bacterium]|nr:zinc ribbon domain-containing protein [Lachnospiraceae bacterium]
MDFFDKLGDRLIEVGREVSDRARDVSDSTKMQYEIRRKKQELDEIYKDLGRKYYEDNKDSADDQITAIRETLAEIEEMEVKVAGFKGGRRCNKCGAVVPMDSGYCNKCGAKLDDSIFEDESEDAKKAEDTEETEEVTED